MRCNNTFALLKYGTEAAFRVFSNYIIVRRKKKKNDINCFLNILLQSYFFYVKYAATQHA